MLESTNLKHGQHRGIVHSFGDVHRSIQVDTSLAVDVSYSVEFPKYSEVSTICDSHGR